MSFAGSEQIFSWTWKVHVSTPCFCTPKCKKGQLFNAVPVRLFPHNLLSPAAGNMTVGDIATHEIVEHVLKFKLQHLTFLSKDHCKWGHPATYIKPHLLIFGKVWRWGLGPSGKKISSEIFSSCKLFGMIHRPFSAKKIKSLEHMVLGIPCKPHFLVIFWTCKKEKAGWNCNFLWPYFCDGMLFQDLRKNSCFTVPHRAKLFFGSVFFLLSTSRLSGMWA